MWKHKESKWLVRGGRKVKCYLCGKKILAQGDLFLFHGDTGYYSHQSCLTESTTISGNERRRAVKKIAAGAAIATVIAAGAGKLIDISSQSKGSNSPATQTILTSQGLIPPALTSDPANPVPGQMWYRSDAGVMAHFDGVQNRVVYSSEINDGNVNVTSKGIVNGLSVLPNDGKGGFGPDTTSGATAPGQYGGTYTVTSGALEGINYCIANKLTKIHFSGGVYYITAFTDAGTSYSYPAYSGLPIPQVYSDGTLVALEIEGEGGYNWSSSSSTDSNSSTIFYLKADASSTLPTSSAYVSSIIKLVLPSGQSSGSNTLTGSYTFRNFIVRLDPNFSENSFSVGLSGINAQDGANLFIMDNVLVDVDGIGNSPTPTYPVPSYISGNGSLYSTSAVILPGSSNYINDVHITNSFVVYWQTAWVFPGDLAVLERCGHSYCNYGFSFANNATTFWVIRDHFHQATPNLFIVHFSSPSDFQIVIFDNLNMYNVAQFGTYTPASDNNALSGIMTWSTPQGANGYNPVISTPFASGQGKYMKVTNLNIYTILPPTTPSVPTSATAQENTNPYAVDVYVYGGDVTKIQITKNGTAYTVFSVSTAIAMSGQAYKLNPGDSITVTYSTAPTWEWLSD